MPHEPTSDTVTRKKALTRNTGILIPAASVAALVLVLCGWAYNKIEAHDRTTIKVEHLQEKCVEADRDIQIHAEQINEAKAERVYMRAKLDDMHQDIQEIKQAVKGR